MLRNASDIFLAQISQRKFIETLEDVLTSPRTSPVVRERLMEVLAAAAYITSRMSSWLPSCQRLTGPTRFAVWSQRQGQGQGQGQGGISSFMVSPQAGR